MTRQRAQPPDAVFLEMLRAARELLAVRSPLDAELIVSEMLGTAGRLRATSLLPQYLLSAMFARACASSASNSVGGPRSRPRRTPRPEGRSDSGEPLPGYALLQLQGEEGECLNQMNHHEYR